eukprot:scaffold8055_cov156-Cylindrotheca_fusiformis.AAC.3
MLCGRFLNELISGSYHKHPISAGVASSSITASLALAPNSVHQQCPNIEHRIGKINCRLDRNHLLRCWRCCDRRGLHTVASEVLAPVACSALVVKLRSCCVGDNRRVGSSKTFNRASVTIDTMGERLSWLKTTPPFCHNDNSPVSLLNCSQI